MPQNSEIIDENYWICKNCETQNVGNYCKECGTKKGGVKVFKKCQKEVHYGENYCINCGTKIE